MRPSKTAEGARLARLVIEDFGLIARAEIEFADGFTAFTGETGSGKTMVLGALAFVLGERASTDDVRQTASRARVTLEVEPGAALRSALSDDGFAPDPTETAIFMRDLQTSGKSSARINGTLATAAQLRSYGARLLESIGQHEHQRLLSPAYQLDLLDAFGGGDARALRSRVRAGYERTVALGEALRELGARSVRAQTELDDARFTLAEIDEATPVLGEDAALRERRDVLANGERISAALEGAHAALATSEAAAIETLGAAAAALAPVARFSQALDSLREVLAALQSDATDAAAALAREREQIEFDSTELEAATARLDRLERLKKKYGGSLAEVLAVRARSAEIVELAGEPEQREREARLALSAAREQWACDATALSRLRSDAAGRLEQRVGSELAALAMPAARFEVAFTPLVDPSASGADRVEFTLSPNPGEPVRPLARAASGGELSRLLLALSVVLAGERAEEALVFDEIDAGIGGATASAVGSRIGMLARATQVVCVTHLAQIAAYADRHYALRKRSENRTTLIEVAALDDDDARRTEIARMLSGNANAAAVRHAATLLEDSREQRAADATVPNGTPPLPASPAAAPTAALPRRAADTGGSARRRRSET